MTTTRTAHTEWSGSLLEGSGTTSLDSSGTATFDVSWPSRAEEPAGRTSPEELLAAAHSACFSMALSAALSRAGTPPRSLSTRVEVDLLPGTGITGIRIIARGDVPDLDAAGFAEAAAGAKDGCPVSKALQAVPIELTVE